MTHAERQEAFKARSKAKGGKGGPKGVVAPATTSVVPTPAPTAKGHKEADKAKPKSEEPKIKKAVPGKKAAYLAEKKRKQAEKDGTGGAAKKSKSD